MDNQKPLNQTARTPDVWTKKTRIFSSALLGWSLSVTLTAAHPALAQVNEFITFDDLRLSVLDDVTPQYASKGVVFQGITDSGSLVSLEVADSTLYGDVNPPSLPFALSNFYNHDKTQRAHIMEIRFPGAVGTVSGISMLFNGAGSLGANVVFNVYDPSSTLVDSFTVPAATDSGYHRVTIPDANVGYIDVVAPQVGWAFYIDNLQFTLNSVVPPSSPAVPMALTYSLVGAVRNPIPAPDSRGTVNATATTVRLTSASLLQLAASAHGTTYPKGALLSVTLLGQGQGSIAPVVVMDKTGTNVVDDVSDLLQITEEDSSLQAISGEWKVDPSSQLYLSGMWTGSEMLGFTFDSSAGTSFQFSASRKGFKQPCRSGQERQSETDTVVDFDRGR